VIQFAIERNEEIPTLVYEARPVDIFIVVPTTNVIYSVGGELFQAHKAIFATQSPVLKAESYTKR
jgi:hypothetical protein